MTTDPAGAPPIRDVVVRHPKERLSKCSLEPLRGRADIIFHRAVPEFTFDATGFILLQVDAPVLSDADARMPLLLLDSTWRLLPKLEASLRGHPVPRSLPPWLKTAYPRISKITPDPTRGLASVEALYAARFLQGRSTGGLLDAYHWKAPFLAQFEGR
jgi:pre-rRNA-processing protein TSR3